MPAKPTGPFGWYLWQIKTAYLLPACTLMAIVLVRNLLVGVITPIYVARLITHLGSSELSHDVFMLVVAAVAAGMAEVIGLGFRQYVSFGVRRALINTLGDLEHIHLPLARFKQPITGAVNDFFDSWRDVMMTIFNRAPIVVVGFGGLIVMSLKNGMVLMVITASILAIAAPIIMYVTTKKVLPGLRRASSAERREQAMLSSIFEHFDMRLLHPILREEMVHCGQEAARERHLASWLMRRRTSEVQFLNVALVISAVIMATVYFATGHGATNSALIVTIVLVLASNLSLIHTVLDTFYDVQSRAEGLTNVLRQGIKKLPMPAAKPGESGIRARNLRVVYLIEMSDGLAKEKKVIIPDTTIDQPGLICLSAESGRGKSTFFHAIIGFIDYQGSVTVGGREAKAFIGTRAGLVRQQLKDKELDLQIAKLFGLKPAVSQGPDWELCQQMLAWVGFPEAIPEQTVSSLSGGERRRILTAFGLYWAIKLDLDAVILDEPTNDLDVSHILALREGLRAFASAYGIYVIVASHNTIMQEAADQVIPW